MRIFNKNFSVFKNKNQKSIKVQTQLKGNTTLADLVPGQSGIVLSVGGEEKLRIRLLDMGIIPKTQITVVKVAPMGDPIELYLRGYALSLRKKDAENIYIERIHAFHIKGGKKKWF